MTEKKKTRQPPRLITVDLHWQGRTSRLEATCKNTSRGYVVASPLIGRLVVDRDPATHTTTVEVDLLGAPATMVVPSSASLL